jgi:hypothetical protein
MLQYKLKGFRNVGRPFERNCKVKTGISSIHGGQKTNLSGHIIYTLRSASFLHGEYHIKPYKYKWLNQLHLYLTMLKILTLHLNQCLFQEMPSHNTFMEA